MSVWMSKSLSRSDRYLLHKIYKIVVCAFARTMQPVVDLLEIKMLLWFRLCGNQQQCEYKQYKYLESFKIQVFFPSCTGVTELCLSDM